MPNAAGRTRSRRRWMLAFAPAAAVFALWVVSAGSWIVWQGPNSSQVRALLGRGVFLVNWGTDVSEWGIGRVTWQMGTNFTVNGQYVTWYAARPYWEFSREELCWLPEIHRGHVRIPLFPLSVLVAGMTALVLWRRSRRVKPGCCPGCGYDLTGTSAPQCPECGAPVGATPGPPVL